ncbi:hypothetical protein [Pseudonocardia humida]|uniref:DUF4129 domain-containing protein n=1 Tax=Pseudonocardia humida TaxID=2800819 RepID=A0ABT0ZV13_9PSEU|nr:hypothetical protein [Pseudonocardia humida]MCO1654514.1 hypothetical protein [Pseudonocardia humida]
MGRDWDGHDHHWFGPHGGPGPRGGPGWHDAPGFWPVLPALLATLLAAVVVLAVLWRSGWLDRLVDRARPRPVAAAPTADWDDAVRRFGDVAAEYAAFECDPRSVLDLPALVDVRRPATARFVDAFAEVSALLTDDHPGAPHAGEFVAAVERAERSWTAAVDAARRHGASGFSDDERALIDQVRTLLEVVASSPFDAERRTAFEQARGRFAELEKRTGWRLPAPAAVAIEDRARGALVGSAD